MPRDYTDPRGRSRHRHHQPAPCARSRQAPRPWRSAADLGGLEVISRPDAHPLLGIGHTIPARRQGSTSRGGCGQSGQKSRRLWLLRRSCMAGDRYRQEVLERQEERNRIRHTRRDHRDYGVNLVS